MISYLSRSGNLSQYLKATSQAVASNSKTLATPAVVSKKEILVSPATERSTSYGLSKTVLTGPVSVTSGVGISTQIRFYHTDIKTPDFGHYRRDSTKDPTSRQADTADGRRAFTYLFALGGGVSFVYGSKSVVNMFVGSMSASADVLAMAKIEIKLADIPEGRCMTFKWRGKPLFVKHRSAEEIERERGVNVASLRDPQHDSERVQKPDWLVLIGVCTHLGCVPIANSGDYAGFYCPCHGSHYDASGRIRKGPAPLNLEVPTYEFPSDDLLVVG